MFQLMGKSLGPISSNFPECLYTNCKGAIQTCRKCNLPPAKFLNIRKPLLDVFFWRCFVHCHLLQAVKMLVTRRLWWRKRKTRRKRMLPRIRSRVPREARSPPRNRYIMLSVSLLAMALWLAMFSGQFLWKMSKEIHEFGALKAFPPGFRMVHVVQKWRPESTLVSPLSNNRFKESPERQKTVDQNTKNAACSKKWIPLKTVHSLHEETDRHQIFCERTLRLCTMKDTSGHCSGSTCQEHLFSLATGFDL